MMHPWEQFLASAEADWHASRSTRLLARVAGWTLAAAIATYTLVR